MLGFDFRTDLENNNKQDTRENRRLGTIRENEIVEAVAADIVLTCELAAAMSARKKSGFMEASTLTQTKTYQNDREKKFLKDQATLLVDAIRKLQKAKTSDDTEVATKQAKIALDPLRNKYGTFVRKIEKQFFPEPEVLIVESGKALRSTRPVGVTTNVKFRTNIIKHVR
ncbi:MAG: hypothetical protein WC521_02520 [Bdellovibrionales bacterium]|jgi:hypothetical protein